MARQPASLAQTVISSPADAWDLLRAISAGELDALPSLRIAGWRCELMRISHGQSATISVSMMKALLEVQAQLNKSFGEMKSTSAQTRRLTIQEKTQLELNIIVTPNGNVYSIDVQKILETFAREIAKMDSKHKMATAVIVSLVIAVGLFGSDIFKAYLASNKEVQVASIQSEQLIALSKEETARAKLMGALVAQSAEARQAAQHLRPSTPPRSPGAARSPSSASPRLSVAHQ